MRGVIVASLAASPAAMLDASLLVACTSFMIAHNEMPNMQGDQNCKFARMSFIIRRDGNVWPAAADCTERDLGATDRVTVKKSFESNAIHCIR